MLALVALALAGFVLSGCGGDGDGESSDNAHVNEDSGSVNGLFLDEREGPAPPPAKVKDLEKAAGQASCLVYLENPEEGNKELPRSAPEPEYEADPPISGDHVEPPYQQADGAYRLMPRPVDMVASLDNGRMQIQYAPDLAEGIQLELKGLYDTMYGGTLLFPNEVMNYAVAATTWTNRLVCPGWRVGATLDAIRAFGKETWGKFGNNPVDSLPFEGPTPADPDEPSGDE